MEVPAREGRLARRLGLFDAAMIVMGGVVGSGILINPYVAARQVRTPALIFAAWAFGGLVAPRAVPCSTGSTPIFARRTIPRSRSCTAGDCCW